MLNLENAESYRAMTPADREAAAATVRQLAACARALAWVASTRTPAGADGPAPCWECDRRDGAGPDWEALRDAARLAAAAAVDALPAALPARGARVAVVASDLDHALCLVAAGHAVQMMWPGKGAAGAFNDGGFVACGDAAAVRWYHAAGFRFGR